MFKQVKHLIPAQEIDMKGIVIMQALPTQNVLGLDPFLLLHHGEFTFRDDAPARHQGIGPHPHRGFSPVTFVIEGEIRHQDSRGNNQVAKKDEVQWMHAGAGIIHSERPTQELVENGGLQEIIQLWINSPSAKKMNQPMYQFLNSKSQTRYLSKDKRVVNKVIAGSHQGNFGKIKTESELLIIWSEGQTGGKETYTIPSGFNAMIYLIKGNVRLVGYGTVESKQLAVFDEANGDIEVNMNSEAQFLILAGRPLNEKITQSGPYVMNTQTQIMEAMRDYQMGKMGILIEEI